MLLFTHTCPPRDDSLYRRLSPENGKIPVRGPSSIENCSRFSRETSLNVWIAVASNITLNC
jgi:hypothetical protein